MSNTTPFGFLFNGDDFFETVFGKNAWREFNQMFSSPSSSPSSPSFPPHNIYALKDGSAKIEFALAGYNQDDIALRAEDGKIVIECKSRKTEDTEGCCNEESEECVYHGIRAANFRKSISMPTKFDLSKITAKMKNGMLTILVPLAEERKPRDIKVDIATD